MLFLEEFVEFVPEKISVSAAANEDAVFYDDKLIHLAHNFRFMGDDQDSMVFFEFFQNFNDFLSSVSVKCGGDLIKEENFRFAKQGAGERQELLLSSGKVFSVTDQSSIIAVF